MKLHPDARVIHITECLAAGTLSFLEQATRELAASGVRQVLVYSRRPDTPEDLESRFDHRVWLVEVPGPGRGLGAYVRALRTVMTQELGPHPGQALVHLHSSKAGFAGRLALLGLARRPRVLYSPHGLSYLNRRSPLAWRLFRALEWMAARVDCTLVGCGRSEADELTRLSGRPAEVLENAVHGSFLQLTPARPAGQPPLVLAMGRACYQKAPEAFAALAVQFRIAEIQARFVWVGAGEAAAEARLRAAGVEITGWVGREEIQALLQQASVFVQTSRWEGMPLSVLQALSAGVPCVVTDVVGNRDAVRQGITGFVTQRFDEMLVCVRRLLEDPDLHGRFSEAARRDARRRFDSEGLRLRLLDLYARTLAPRPAEPLAPAPRRGERGSGRGHRDARLEPTLAGGQRAA
jgi:glycosyltransferase involved in cell wall biosynthesis